MPPPLVRLRGVERSFGATRAVAGADLEVGRGRVLALLGPSGCGKTTLLRVVAGFERPDAGTVEIAGAVVASPDVWLAPERRRVGMVFQDYALFPHLTVAENVGFGLPRRQRRSSGRSSRVDDVLELVGLAELARRSPHQLSGGQQQRVALARALAPEPDLVLLDEPFSNLDAALRAQVRTDVHRILRAAGATAIIVTHDQEEALSVADEVAVMREGRIAAQAPPEVLYHAPDDRQVASFVGEAEWLPGRCDGCVVATELGELRLARAAAAGDVDVLVRPEDLVLSPDDDGEATVIGRQFYGHDQVLVLRLDSGRELRARLGPVTQLRPGDRCRVSVETRVHAFTR